MIWVKKLQICLSSCEYKERDMIVCGGLVNEWYVDEVELEKDKVWLYTIYKNTWWLRVQLRIRGMWRSIVKEVT